MKNWILYIGLGWMLIACGQPSSEGSDAAQAQQVLPVTEQQARSILAEYLQIKDALVASDAEKAKQQLSSLSAMLGQGESDFHRQLGEAIQQMSEASDIDQQRVAFEGLSKAMDPLRSAWEGEIYKQYCPMAFDNKGAYWYSSEEEILNPYFGDAMLRCGRVIHD